MTSWLQIRPPERAREAQREISSAWVRLGKFDEAIRSSPDGDPLITSFSTILPETAEVVEGTAVKAVRNRLGSWDVPAQVNGLDTRLIFDTGANFSGVCESEAKRLGLSVHDSNATVAGFAGTENHVRVASAVVKLGDVRISNVVFLVIPDNAMYLAPLRLQMHGFLGMPAIRALKRIGISRDCTLRINPPESPSVALNREPNLFFDGMNLVMEVSHGERRLQFVVDTGAFSSEFYPSFRSSLTAAEMSTMKRVRQKEGGVGGKDCTSNNRAAS